MLELIRGNVGNKGVVSLEFAPDDKEKLKEISRTMPKFFGSNGCGLNLIEILQGKTILPCNDDEFEAIKICVEEFNNKYFVKDYKQDYENLLEQFNFLTKVNTELNEKCWNLEEKLKNIMGILGDKTENEMKVYNYPAILEINEDCHNLIGIRFPNFSGDNKELGAVISVGDTREEAIDMGAEALLLHLEGLLDEGVELPEPIDCKDIELEENETLVYIIVKM